MPRLHAVNAAPIRHPRINRRGVEQRAKTTLVDLAGEKVQPRLKPRPRDGSGRRRELSRRIAVRDVLGDRGGFEKHAAVIEHQSG
jgi:hypothetical protein